MTDFEQDLNLVFEVRIRSYGRPKDTQDRLGLSLAKCCGLHFADVEVRCADTIYRWSPEGHNGSGSISVDESHRCR